MEKKISGTADRPRLIVFRSLKHIYVQVIDDEKGCTLVSASTLSKELVDKLKGKKKKEQSSLVGELIGKKCIQQGIAKVVFDRGEHQYHGRIQAIADAARTAGLKF
jgi:large subunit ribosomal protein L18